MPEIMDTESLRKRIINREFLCRSPGRMSISVQTGVFVQSGERQKAMEIKGLVIDTKVQAILILTPTGKTVVVKADGDHFARATKLATRRDWMCFTGKGEIVNATATFTQVSANQEADYHDNAVVRVICDNYCDHFEQTGFCYETLEEIWTQLDNTLASALRTLTEVTA